MPLDDPSPISPHYPPLSSTLVTVSLFFISMSLVQREHIFSFYFTFTLEPPISAIMMESLRFIPPLNDSENAFCFSIRLKADSIRSISIGYIFRGIPFIWKKEAEFRWCFQLYLRNILHQLFSYIIYTVSSFLFL